MKFTIVLEPSAEGGFTAYAPSLPGCISEGDTKQEALENIKKAIELYIALLDDDRIIMPGMEFIELSV